MKNLKKLVSMLLVAAMVMAMGLTAMAAQTTATETKTVKLTIDKAAAGHTYTVYQMLKGDVSGLTNGSGTLANVVAGKNLTGTVEAFDTAIRVKDNEGKATDEYMTGTDLANAASAMINAEGAYDVFDTVETDAVQTIFVEPGYYVVKDTYQIGTAEDNTAVNGTAYMVAVVGDTTMKPKTSTPDIDKNITDTDANKALETGDSKKTDTAAIGDVINYKVTSAVPVTEGYKYYYYVVDDTMSEGLTYNKDLVITIGESELTTDEYTLTETDNSFKLVVKDMKQYTAGAAIVITYTATVNEHAKIGTEANTNTVKLTYSNNPTDTYNKDKNPNNEPGKGDAVGITPNRVTKTYVTELTINKVDEKGEILNGAEFTLSGTNLNKVKVTTTSDFVKVEEGKTGEYYKLKDGTFTKTAPSEAKEGEEGYNADKYESTTPDYNLVVTMSTDAEVVEDKEVVATLVNGIFTITGLNAGDYTLTETKTPEGYNTIEPIKFTITAGQTGADALIGGNIVWGIENESKENVVSLDATNGVYNATIVNKKGNTLPSTGGMGTTIFYVLGTILVLGAGVVLISKKRMAR